MEGNEGKALEFRKRKMFMNKNNETKQNVNCFKFHILFE